MYQIKGKIDSNNAGYFEKKIMAVMPKEIDASELNYISSAGLRVLMKLKKAVGDVTMTFSNVIPDEKRRIFSAYVMKEFMTSYEKSNLITTML